MTNGKTITVLLSDAEHADLARTAEREKVNLSDYVRMRLGLRSLGEEAAEPTSASADDRLDDHERRLAALEQLAQR